MPATANIARSSDTLDILCMENNKIVKYKQKDLLKKYKIEGIIRLQEEDFKYIKPKMLLAHFNLQYSMGRRGKIYGIVLILDTGFYDGKKERLPILDFNKMYRAVCLKTRNNVTYENLVPEDFKHSLKNIKSVRGLKKAMLRRYTKTMPSLTEKEILSLGVSIREFKLL